jgi:hypothetical protein
MMFVYPAFLWALFATALPIIIHLFNFRRYKKVYFTNVKFLKEIQHESKSKSRLKELLILLSRILIITCLVFAFSQPVLVENTTNQLNSGASAVSVYIDNSFSMENVQKQGPLLEVAKQQAVELVKAGGGADKFQILTNDFEGKHQRFYGKEDAIERIKEIKSSSSVKKISEVYARQKEFLKGSTLSNKKIWLFSDAQKSTFDLKEVKIDTSLRTGIVFMNANKVNNCYVDTCWFETPVQQKGFIQKLHAKIKNAGSEVINAGTARLFLSEQQLSIAAYSLESGATKEVIFTFECKENGFNFGFIKIDDYPVTFDDRLYFAFNSKVSIRTVLINSKDQTAADPFEKLFKTDSLFQFTVYNEKAVDYGSFASTDVVVLDQLSSVSTGLISELAKFVERGGNIFVVPSLKSIKEEYNALLDQFKIPQIISLDTAALRTEKIEKAGNFYTGVFEKMDDRVNLPLVNRHFKIQNNSLNIFESLLVLQNGDPLLLSSKYGNGNVYFCSAPLDSKSGNFAQHALFVPTVYRICFSSIRSVPLFYQVNANNVLSVKNNNDKGDEPPHVIGISSKTDVIPESHITSGSKLLYTRSQINAPGFYKLSQSKTDIFPLAFNYSRAESDLTCLTPADLQKTVKENGWKNVFIVEQGMQGLANAMIDGVNGQKLWKLFIILALTFALIEILLLKLLK